MPKQLGPLPNSEFPDKSLEIALKAYLKTLEQVEQELADYSDISRKDIRDIENALEEIYEFLLSSRSAQAILPYRIQLIQSLQKAITQVKAIKVLMGEPARAISQRDLMYEIISELDRTRHLIQSIQDNLRLGLEKPLFPTTRTP